MKEVGEEIELN